MHQQCKYCMYILLHIMQLFKENELGMFIFPISQISFSNALLLLLLAVLSLKGRLYCSVVYIILHISNKRTVPWMEIHLLDSYSMWHEIATWDIVEEARGVESQGKHISTIMEKNIGSI